MGIFSEIHTFKANENNSYEDYFSLYDNWDEVIKGEKTRAEVYKEHLQTAPKDKLIDMAIEAHTNYQWANDLAWDRGIEIEELNQKVAEYNNMAYNSKLACSIAIISCSVIIGVFYIYQFIKFRLRKYADKIRSETIEALKAKQDFGGK